MKTLLEQFNDGDLSDDAEEFCRIMASLSDDDISKLAGYIEVISQEAVNTFKRKAEEALRQVLPEGYGWMVPITFDNL